MQKSHVIILASSVLLNMEAVAQEKTMEASKLPTNTPATKQDPRKNNVNNDELLAEVNSKKIMKSFFNDEFKNTSKRNQKKILKKVISSELLVQYASKDPFFNDPKIIKSVDKKAKDLRDNGEDFTDVDRRMVLGLAVINKLAYKNTENMVNEKEITKHYNAIKNKFNTIPYVQAYDIKAPTLLEAKKIIHRLKNVDKNDLKNVFVKVNEVYNKNEESHTCHLEKIYKYGIPNTAYNKVLFSLKEGTYTTTPVTDENGAYHVIYCEKKGTDKTAPSQKEIEDNIIFVLKNKFANKWLIETRDKLKKEAKIINYLDQPTKRK